MTRTHATDPISFALREKTGNKTFYICIHTYILSNYGFIFFMYIIYVNWSYSLLSYLFFFLPPLRSAQQPYCRVDTRHRLLPLSLEMASMSAIAS